MTTSELSKRDIVHSRSGVAQLIRVVVGQGALPASCHHCYVILPRIKLLRIEKRVEFNGNAVLDAHKPHAAGSFTKRDRVVVVDDEREAFTAARPDNAAVTGRMMQPESPTLTTRGKTCLQFVYASSMTVHRTDGLEIRYTNVVSKPSRTCCLRLYQNAPVFLA